MIKILIFNYSYFQNAHELGTYFLLELAKLRDEYDFVGDVRGKGFMIGVEFVDDKVRPCLPTG